MKNYNLKKLIARGCVWLFVLCGGIMISACGKSGDEAAQQKEVGTITESKGVEVTIPGSIHGSDVDREKELPTGDYVVKVSREGYQPVWKVVKVSANETEEITSQLIPVSASVLIKSEPAGAEVYIDGEKRGVTPCVVSNLKRGSYDLTFRRLGHDDITRKLDILSAVPLLVEETLTQNTGVLTVTFSPADAEVYLNGQRKHGNSPLQLKESSGTYKLEIRKNKYEPVTDTVKLDRGGEVNKEYILNPLPGSLTVHVTEPSNAVITLDGKQIKNGQLVENLAPGEYTVSVSAKGFDQETQKVKIAAAEMRDLQIKLNANTGKIILPVNEPYVTITFNGRIIGMTQPDRKNPDAAENFEISGVPVGTYKLSFQHPNTPKAEECTVTISKEKREVQLPRVNVWLPNADVTMQGRVYRGCRITPVEGTDRVRFEQRKVNSDGSIGKMAEDVPKNKLKIDYYGDKSAYANPEFKTSYVNLLTFDDNLASITINNLVPGCEVFINGESKGIVRSSSIVMRVKPDSYTIRIAHKHGVNVKNPNQNYVEYTKKLVLARGGERTMNAPGSKILWIPDTKLILKNNGVVIGKIVEENEDSITIQTGPSPAKKQSVPLKNLDRKEPLN